MLDLSHDLTRLRGADYNPRRIDDGSLETLKESVRRLGVVKPIIVRSDLIVAGHQRTKALRALGETTGPVYVLPAETTTYDEIRFNQLHNGTDFDSGDEDCRIVGVPLQPGYQLVGHYNITGNGRARMANVRTEIASLILKYGPWGGCVATLSGRVIHCGQYALAAMATRTRLTVYGIPDDREDEYRSFLSRQYGEFSYEGLQRSTYVQTFAQMHRLREGPSGRTLKSTLYETMVIPWLAEHPNARVIDFGSGQGDYAAKLRKAGHKVDDVELFRRVKGEHALDVTAVNRMIDRMCKHLEQHGPYDAVVCDSVLNSVDSLQAEAAVMTMLNALCRPGGAIFWSGRQIERLESQNRYTISTAKKGIARRYIEFLDRDGFSALFRGGHWFFQKFHSSKDVADLTEKYGMTPVKVQDDVRDTSFQVHAAKTSELPGNQVRGAVDFEFNLPVSDKRRLCRSGDVWTSLQRLYLN